MAGDAARTLDPEFPHVDPDVVAGYRSAPETMVAEIIGGELSLMPRPHRQHVRAAGELHGELRGPFDRGRDGPGGWMLMVEPELRLGPRPDVLVPDIAGWRRTRLPVGFLARETPAFIDLAPDWVCEVLSPSTEQADRGRKLDVYRREGVGHVWLVSPVLRTVEVFRRHDLGWLLVATFAGDERVRAEPFDAVELDLGVVWAAE
ncbi:MAG: Uma2 family endonuclease [Deltaproteobacteria bacterium]|nr:Uma2 family endonuclease [Myxococcales bacterium]MDP3212535.1 Uma2 family endonuclease [Deltaproteobacteria bacterium]